MIQFRFPFRKGQLEYASAVIVAVAAKRSEYQIETETVGLAGVVKSGGEAGDDGTSHRSVIHLFHCYQCDEMFNCAY